MAHSQPRFAGTPVPTPPISDDDRSASSELVAHLAGLAAGTSTGEQVLAALVGARLLVPVVAVLDEADENADGLRQEKNSSMATVMVANASGGRALLAFSSSAALVQWHPDARPVPLAAPLAARAAVDEGADTLLIDVAGPMPFALAGHELLLVGAASSHPAGAYEDPVLREALRRHMTRVKQVKGASRVPANARASTPERQGQAHVATPGVLTLVVTDDDRSWLKDFASQIASDRVVLRLLPDGLRVRAVTDGVAQDTPSTLPGSATGL